MRIRRLLFLAWVMISFGTILMTGFVGRVIGFERSNPHNYASILTTISTEHTQWNDAPWQQAIQSQMHMLTYDITIWDSASKEIYSSNAVRSQANSPDQTAFVVENGKLVGTVGIFGPAFAWEPWAITAIVIEFIALIIIGLLIGRLMIRPLDSMSRAARQIAAGDLAFDLPAAWLREVQEVAQAFDDMRNGLHTSLIRQAELEQERRFFISAIAHDLGTPLFALRGYLEGLEKGLATTPEKATQYIHICQEKANALEHLITDLFAYSRLEYLEQTPQRAPMDFSKLVSRTVEDIRFQAAARSILLSVDSDCSSCEVSADWSLLARVFDNLLDNALRHTPDFGSIKITWYKQDNLVGFSVIDSGPGIAPNDLPHLFTPLYRAETSRSRETGGAGLGLTIARRILQAHGGNLIAGNCSDSGAVFTGSFKAV